MSVMLMKKWFKTQKFKNYVFEDKWIEHSMQFKQMYVS